MGCPLLAPVPLVRWQAVHGAMASFCCSWFLTCFHLLLLVSYSFCAAPVWVTCGLQSPWRCPSPGMTCLLLRVHHQLSPQQHLLPWVSSASSRISSISPASSSCHAFKNMVLVDRSWVPPADWSFGTWWFCCSGFRAGWCSHDRHRAGHGPLPHRSPLQPLATETQYM